MQVLAQFLTAATQIFQVEQRRRLPQGHATSTTRADEQTYAAAQR
jgi:hypothetical protein